MLSSKPKFYFGTFFVYIITILVSLSVPYYLFGKGFDLSISNSGSSDDGFGMQAIAKSIMENGVFGLYFNDKIGTPQGSFLVDFAGVDPFLAIICYLISLFTSNYHTIIYVYYLLTFVFSAISMLWVMKKLGFDNFISIVIALLFAFAPYHFMRGMDHLTLSNNMSIPLVIFVASYIIGYAKVSKLSVVISSILIGLGYGYYYFFGLIVLGLAFIFRMLSSLDWRKNIKSCWPICLVIITVIITLMPKIGVNIIYGKNIEAGARVFWEQEIYGLRIIQMLLPVDYSRFSWLSSITHKYESVVQITENRTSNLGLVSSFFFILSLVLFALSVIGNLEIFKNRFVLFKFLSFSSIFLVLIGTIGGFGEIFNWLITPQIRCYNRSSILIMGICLVLGAIFISSYKSKKILYLFSLILILCLGFADQIPKRSSPYWQQSIKTEMDMYKDYFAKIEDALPQGSMIYQIPFMDYPEAGWVNKIYDYHQFYGYLNTKSLKWTYGGVRGRQNLAKELYIDGPLSKRLIYGLQENNFAGVLVDTDGFADNGKEVIDFYNNLYGTPIISGDGKLYFYDIKDINENLDPFAIEFGKFYSFQKNNNYVKILSTKGLSSAEEWGTWTDANQGNFSIEFDLPRKLSSNINVHMDLAMIFNGKQNVDVYVNGEKRYSKLVENGLDTYVEFTVERTIDNHVKIDFDLPNSVSPDEISKSGDTRKIALGLKGVVFTQVEK